MIQKILENQQSSSSSSKSCTKLRDLIKNIRACKTQAEERALVQKEKAKIRESFSNNEAEYRPRNVAKLLFIHMLGHNTDFGQMECLNLITANSFTEKRIGYLGLTQLFHEQSEVLMMATNRIHHDLNSSSNYVISLALIALSEICTAEMCRDLTKDVLNIMGKGTSFVKKKAALAASKIVKKLPETQDQIIEKVEKLMEDRHHGVLLSTLGLIEEMIYLDPKVKENFKKFFTPMIRVMKGLVSSFSAEFDVSGISDPYLQIQILIFFRLMAEGNKELSDEVSDTLANVANTTSPNKNTGNAVLYECVITIMGIESTPSLKTLGINILGKFLTHKDANSKYCSLFMLKKVLNHDINAVSKHKTMIMECLKENDISIKQLALDLTYLISNESNVQQVIKELLNYLLSVNDPEFLKELTLKICLIVDKHSPSRRWYVDTVAKVLTLAGNYIKEESISLLIHLVCSTPDLQSYTLGKLYFSLSENTNQQGLAKATMYLLGEFGQKLSNGEVQTEDGSPITVKENEIVGIVETVFERANIDSTILEYGLTCLLKLYVKLPSQAQRITNIIKKQTHSTSAEVQKRACEYLKVLSSEWQDFRGAICETIPEYEGTDGFNSKPDIQIDDIPKSNNNNSNNNPTSAADVDFDDILGGPTTTTANTNQDNNNNNNNGQQNAVGDIDLLDVFDAPPPQPQNNNNNQQQNQQQQNTGLDILDLYNTGGQQQQQQQFNNNNFGQQQQQNFGMQQQQPVQQQQQNNDPLGDLMFTGNNTQPQQQQAPQNPATTINAFTDSNIDIVFKCTKNGTTTSIETSFNNKTNNIVNDIVFQVAVQKHLVLELNPINNTKIQPNSQGQTTQSMKITNNKQGEKGIAMKVKIGYSINGQQQNNQLVISNFPSGW